MPSTLLVANYPPDVGFAWWLMERFWLEFGRECQDRGRRCILAYPKQGPIPDSILDSTVEPVFVDFTGTGAAQVREQTRFIREHDVTEIYFTDRPYRHRRYSALRRAGVRSIINHDHTPGDRPPARGLRRVVKRLANSMPWITCDFWISISDLMERRAVESGCIPRERCFVVQNGIDPLVVNPDIRMTARGALGLGPGDVGVVTVGRATRYKGLDFFVQVAIEAQMRKAGRFVFFHIGDGPLLPQVREMAATGATRPDDIRFLGRRSDVRALLPGFDLALHPSQGEGFSLAILEYMSAGLVTLVPDILSVAQALEHGRTGFVYENLSVESCLQRLRHGAAALDRRMGAAAREVVAENYTWDRTRKDFRRFLESTPRPGGDSP